MDQGDEVVVGPDDAGSEPEVAKLAARGESGGVRSPSVINQAIVAQTNDRTDRSTRGELGEGNLSAVDREDTTRNQEFVVYQRGSQGRRAANLHSQDATCVQSESTVEGESGDFRGEDVTRSDDAAATDGEQAAEGLIGDQSARTGTADGDRRTSEIAVQNERAGALHGGGADEGIVTIERQSAATLEGKVELVLVGSSSAECTGVGGRASLVQD